MTGGVHVDAVGLLAPGLSSWPAGSPVLIGTTSYAPAPLGPVEPDLLPANESRRAPLAVRMALRACEDAMARSTVPASELASIFATSDADMEIAHRICSVLADTDRGVSPTDFHNSVHNAAAGYWSIGSASRRPSTALGAYDHGLAAGLREAMAMIAVDDTDVLLVLYDVPPPPPLYATRPISEPASVALVLTRRPTASTLGRLSLCEAATESSMEDAGLEALRCSNPALRALPLLQALARRKRGVIGIRTDANAVAGIELSFGSGARGPGAPAS